MAPKMVPKNSAAQKAAPKPAAASKPVERRGPQAALEKKATNLKRSSHELEADEEDAEENKEIENGEEEEEIENGEEEEEEEEEDDEDDDDDMWNFSGEESDEEEAEGEEGEDGEEDEGDEEEVDNDEEDEFKEQSLKISLDKDTQSQLMEKVTKVKNDFMKSKRTEVTPGVIFLGRIPHGFYEAQMKKFFSQFGNVTRLRISRNKKTGKSKHYAFVEFEFSEVAAIVAETMNNYLMFGSLMKSEIVPAEKIHPKMFHGSDRPKKPVNHKKHEMKRRAKPQTPEQHKKTLKKLVSSDAKKKQKLMEQGIEYDFPGYTASVPAKPKRQTFDD